ncbi:MAG TPA: NAD-binding protein [Anaerolineae bacterium]|nr:NAD-binding protein [Anaerolineae bacterium]
MEKQTRFWPKWQHNLRQDLRVFRRLFPWRTGILLVAGIALLAAVYAQAHNRLEGPLSYVKAIYAILNMMAFQVSFADMPVNPGLDIFFVVTPLLGLPLLLVFGANMLNVVRIFFVRAERGQLWQMALADTVARPIVICGLGRVGYRIATQLLDVQRPLIGIDAAPSHLVEALMERGMPVILGDVRNEETLHRAGVDRATDVLVCTQNDLANIEAAFHVREHNPDANIILRLFEETLADEVKQHFAIKAVISRSALAAQAFAHAALGLEILEIFDHAGVAYALAKIPLNTMPPLATHSVASLAARHTVTVVCLYREGQMIIEPAPHIQLHTEDILFIFTKMESLLALSLQGSRHRELTAPAIIVCGLGHTGYRVVQALQTLKCQVVALDFEANPLSEQLREQGTPVLYGDFRQAAVLEAAGLPAATAIVACTEDDMVNFETGLRARDRSPGIRVVMRIFEEALGPRLQQAFHIDAIYSTSAIAAPAFVSAALNLHVTQPVRVGDAEQLIACVHVAEGGQLCGATIAQLNQRPGLTVLLYASDDAITIPPPPGQQLAPGDAILVLAAHTALKTLSLSNEVTCGR